MEPIWNLVEVLVSYIVAVFIVVFPMVLGAIIYRWIVNNTIKKNS